MKDRELLCELLAAETEEAVIRALESRGLMEKKERWRYLGGMPNNQSIVHAQQSTAAAALIEKFTNGQDALLMRYCKAAKIDPRGAAAPKTMQSAIKHFLGATAEAFDEASDKAARTEYAEQNLVLYATGSKARPSLSFYDNGEGQLAKDFPTTFCSLIHGSAGGSYKGAIPFVQGRFNMGSSGVLPFCSEKHKLQLIVSRVPSDVAGGDHHEWAFTVICFFHSQKDPSWHYLVGPDGEIYTAGREPLGLIPMRGLKSSGISPPREQEVPSGTLVKMYDFKAPKSNICGELFRKIEDFLLRPPLPMRIVECRPEYQANVMRLTIWDRLEAWGERGRFEPGFEEGASISIQLETGEVIPAEIRVFKAAKKSVKGDDSDLDQPQTGLRALINGQSHARRDAQFFRTQAVDKEHIAGSMLVLLDCTGLGQESRNAIFMSNRETFREDPLLSDLFKKLQRELKEHEGLKELNSKRYEEKIKDAVNDEEGVKALEELLQSDKDLAQLFGTMFPGSVAAKTAKGEADGDSEDPPVPFKGEQFPTFFRRKDGKVSVNVEIPVGEVRRVSFLTDVRNDYFSRKRQPGKEEFTGDIKPTSHLFNGRYTLTYAVEKKQQVGVALASHVLITDNKGSGPFQLNVRIMTTQAPAEKKEPKPPSPPPPPRSEEGPSRIDVQEVKRGAEAPPLTIEPVPNTERFKLLLNVESSLLAQAKATRPQEEEAAVSFVFKYGLALAVLALLDKAKKNEDWKAKESSCRSQIEEAAAGIARVIVPLCLSLPKKLPKGK